MSCQLSPRLEFSQVKEKVLNSTLKMRAQMNTPGPDRAVSLSCEKVRNKEHQCFSEYDQNLSAVITLPLLGRVLLSVTRPSIQS